MNFSLKNYLIEKQTTWIQQNFIIVLRTAYRLANCKKLQDHCLESICVDPKPFITSKKFPLLDKDILYELLKRDDLQVEEIVVWYLNGGVEQTPGLGSSNSNKDEWNGDDFEALKKTLSEFIPLIRFVKISPADFFDKVRPYKAITIFMKK
jgi:hypothetical protein